jgi:hypothetical protein
MPAAATIIGKPDGAATFFSQVDRDAHARRRASFFFARTEAASLRRGT